MTYSLQNYLGLALVSSLLPLSPLARGAVISAAASTPTGSVAPQCAGTCIEISQQVQSQCSQTDQTCLCEQTSTIQAAIKTCLTHTSACSATDFQAAVDYYPQFCSSYKAGTGSVPGVTGDNGIVTAAGSAPTVASNSDAPNLILTTTTNSVAATRTITADQTTKQHDSNGLTLPAILGITLGATLVICLVVAFLVYTHLRRRQMKRRTRIDFLNSNFGGGFAESEPHLVSNSVKRPDRCQSLQSHFMVQPSPVAKDLKDAGFDFGADISRTSTLVSEPAQAHLTKEDLNKQLPDIRASAVHIENSSAPVTALKDPKKHSRASFGFRNLFGDGGDILRSSFQGSKIGIGGAKKNKGSTAEPLDAPEDSDRRDKKEFDATNKI